MHQPQLCIDVFRLLEVNTDVNVRPLPCWTCKQLSLLQLVWKVSINVGSRKVELGLVVLYFCISRIDRSRQSGQIEQ